MTLKYKATERYAFGWTDPLFQQDSFKVNAQRKTGLEDVPTEVLRNLFLANFGGRAVSTTEAAALRLDDIMNVVQELIDRNQVRHERYSHPDSMTEHAYFVLERENGNH